MKSYILPFDVEVEMKTYQTKAFPLGIIKANIFNYDIWLCNKLINCYFSSSLFFDSCEEDIWSLVDGLTTTQSVHLAPVTFEKKGLNIIEFNKEMIKSGHYITGWYNEFFIPQKEVFRKCDYDHDYVIYGYDDKKCVFKSAGYLDDGFYNNFDISYGNYYKSVLGAKMPKICVNYHKINKEYTPTIDLVKIREKLKNYFFSRDVDLESQTQRIYGIDAWDKLIDYVLYKECQGLDMRYSRLYMEHRGIMLKRIQKLTDLSYIHDDLLAKDYYKKVYSKARKLHYMFIKYNLNNDNKLINKMINIIKETNYNERMLIDKVITQIK